MAARPITLGGGHVVSKLRFLQECKGSVDLWIPWQIQLCMMPYKKRCSRSFLDIVAIH